VVQFEEVEKGKVLCTKSK